MAGWLKGFVVGVVAVVVLLLVLGALVPGAPSLPTRQQALSNEPGIKVLVHEATLNDLVRRIVGRGDYSIEGISVDTQADGTIVFTVEGVWRVGELSLKPRFEVDAVIVPEADQVYLDVSRVRWGVLSIPGDITDVIFSAYVRQIGDILSRALDVIVAPGITINRIDCDAERVFLYADVKP